MATTIQFTGPLAVAIAASRGLLDIVWAALAGLGVALLMSTAELLKVRLKHGTVPMRSG